MLVDHYPMYGLRLATPRLELRLPDPDELARLGELAADGVHDPAVMPFMVPWTDQPPADLPRAVITYHWSLLARVTPANWWIPFAVFRDGEVVGTQEISATDFAVMREVGTGSWVGQRFHRQGIGAEMRAAVLHLAFEGLGAACAISDARDDNLGSNGVSRKLGYAPDGIVRRAIRGEPATFQRLRLERAAWAARSRVPVTVVGLEACLAALGAEAAPPRTPEDQA